MTPQEQSILRSMDETTAGIKSIRAKLIDALKSVGVIRGDEASIEYLLDAVLSYWAGAREAASVRAETIRDLQKRPTADAYQALATAHDAVIDRLRESLCNNRTIAGSLNLVNSLIQNRDGWRTGAQGAERKLARLIDAANAIINVSWATRSLPLNQVEALWHELGEAIRAAEPGKPGVPLTMTEAGAKFRVEPTIPQPIQFVRVSAAGIMEQREEILRAFAAKHGCHPDECIQLHGPSGWHVEKNERCDGDGNAHFFATKHGLQIIAAPNGKWQAIKAVAVSGGTAEIAGHGGTPLEAVRDLRRTFRQADERAMMQQAKGDDRTK